jgi:hypothetical protein
LAAPAGHGRGRVGAHRRGCFINTQQRNAIRQRIETGTSIVGQVVDATRYGGRKISEDRVVIRYTVDGVTYTAGLMSVDFATTPYVKDNPVIVHVDPADPTQLATIDNGGEFVGLLGTEAQKRQCR